ncbi:hypothetical protein ACH3XW_24170 [Acanthocheilonema viteae]
MFIFGTFSYTISPPNVCNLWTIFIRERCRSYFCYRKMLFINFGSLPIDVIIQFNFFTERTLFCHALFVPFIL